MSEQQTQTPNPIASLQVVKTGEMAVAAMAAKAKAEVEARYVIALNNPRKIEVARQTILDSCKRFKFAEGARYKKPVGFDPRTQKQKTVNGFSIRFAEEAIKAMRNIMVDSMIVWEDDEKRNIRVTVTDLESNSTYSDDIVIAKTVERKKLKEGQEKLGERKNSYGEHVFIVAATEDDMLNKVNAAKSKVIRNSGLRLVPQDILEEAHDQILKTLADPAKAGDPKAALRNITDSFHGLNVPVSELERYLGHTLEMGVSPSELTDLRAVYTAIRDEETSWAETCPPEPKKATTEGPGEQPGAAAGSVDATVIEKPYEKLQALCKESDVTEMQVHAFMKSKGLAGKTTVELPQASDNNMRDVIATWKTVLPKIKAIKVE